MNTQTPANKVNHFSDEILLGFAKRNLDQLWNARIFADDLADRIEADVARSRVTNRSFAV